ncbi:YkgJ family cysteine cluster protein [Undibacterium sp. SXout11W]|uniref:YkgJ family cysteine cluster protein n=1 Tax=Undibacterium sp. SXout11W TaxID=3413050 RepID=UPI003BF448C7
MLTPDEQDEFLAAIQSVRRVARQLAEKPYPANIMRIVPQIQHAVDDLFAQSNMTGKEIACRAGCSFCCHVRVEAQQPEIDYIAHQLTQLPVAELAHIVEHMRARLAEKQRLIAIDPLQKPPCVLLENQQCMIYENRPAVCRKGHSIDAQQCADGAATIPQHLDIILKAEALMQGVGAAYADVGLPADTKEFTAALFATLTTRR